MKDFKNGKTCFKCLVLSPEKTAGNVHPMLGTLSKCRQKRKEN
jgi:hypothetical protein